MWGQIRLLKKLIWIIFNTHSGSRTDDRTQMGVQTQLKCGHSVCFSSGRVCFGEHTAMLGEDTAPPGQAQTTHLLCARPRPP